MLAQVLFQNLADFLQRPKMSDVLVRLSVFPSYHLPVLLLIPPSEGSTFGVAKGIEMQNARKRDVNCYELLSLGHQILFCQ